MNLAFLNIGAQETVLIVIVILLLFGGKKLPELARGLGRGIREFKDASEGIKREISDQIHNAQQDLDVTKEKPVVAEEKPSEVPTTAEAEEVETPKPFPTFTTPENAVQRQAVQQQQNEQDPKEETGSQHV